MIEDLALRWLVTLLFVFSAGVCVRSIVSNRHSVAGTVSHSLHAVMAIAMAVMAWPRGAELPTRAPMIFFLAAATWFAVVTVRNPEHRAGNAYHTLMMLAMSWMYAAMGGLPLRKSAAAMTGMEMPGMSSGHAGHAGHGGHPAAGPVATDQTDWVGLLNWLCTIGFGAATAFWFYRLVTARIQGSGHTLGLLCQLAMAAGMAIMFGVML